MKVSHLGAQVTLTTSSHFFHENVQACLPGRGAVSAWEGCSVSSGRGRSCICVEGRGVSDLSSEALSEQGRLRACATWTPDVWRRHSVMLESPELLIT